MHPRAAAAALCDALGESDRATDHARAALEILERMREGLPAETRIAFWQERGRRAIRARATRGAAEGASVAAPELGGLRSVGTAETMPAAPPKKR